MIIKTMALFVNPYHQIFYAEAAKIYSIPCQHRAMPRRHPHRPGNPPNEQFRIPIEAFAGGAGPSGKNPTEKTTCRQVYADRLFSLFGRSQGIKMLLGVYMEIQVYWGDASAQSLPQAAKLPVQGHRAPGKQSSGLFVWKLRCSYSEMRPVRPW